MKKFIISLFLFGISVGAFSQVVENKNVEKTSSITVGILQGGGSLVGADFETLLSKNVGMQFGAGLVGFGAGINYHFKPSIRSSFLSFGYWQQGVGSSFAQSAIGPTFVYRAPKWFTAQIGFGYVLQRSSSMTSLGVTSPMILLYSIGAYFPL